MKVKILYSYWSPKDLEQKIDTFLKQNMDKIEITDVQMSNSFGTYATMILYKQRNS